MKTKKTSKKAEKPSKKPSKKQSPEAPAFKEFEQLCDCLLSYVPLSQRPIPVGISH